MLLSTGQDASRLTPAFVRRRLAARPPGGDGGLAAAGPQGLTLAAVLVPLVTHERGMTALFTRRTAHLAVHPGQISFPGGRATPGDRDPVATALRETEEEIGMTADRVEVVGCLDPCDTSTGFLVTPVVGLVAPPVALKLDDFEVAEAFEVPLSFLLDPANRRGEKRRRDGRTREVDAFDYQDRTIWGATARMVINLYEVLYPR